MTLPPYVGHGARQTCSTMGQHSHVISGFREPAHRGAADPGRTAGHDDDPLL